MTVYSVKYLFTKGIQVLENCEVYQTDPGGQYAKRGSIGHADNVFQRIGQECFLSMEEARDKALRMILRKSKALQVQQGKLGMMQNSLIRGMDIK